MILIQAFFRQVVCAGALFCSSALAETFFQQTTPELKIGESATYVINIPASSAGMMKYGVEITVDGVLGYVGLDQKPGVAYNDSQQQFSTATERVMIGDGLASGTWYVTVVNIAAVLPTTYTLTGEVKNISLVQHGSQRLGASLPHYLVSHGRAGNPQSYGRLSDLIAQKAKNAAVFRIDWRDGASANYPSKTGLQGSRFIRPAGKVIAAMLANASVPRARVRLWGHSWGSFLVQETSLNLGGASSLVALDPAETILLSGAIGNVYRDVNFAASATRSLAIVTARGWYGGETEGNTAKISVLLDAKDKKGESRAGASTIVQAGAEDSALHNLPVRCMEYALRKYEADKISRQLVATAFGESGELKNVSGKGPDYSLVSSTDKNKYVKHISLKKKGD